MRKYDVKNKRNIAVVVVICTIILTAFSLFMKHVNDAEKKIYTLDVNSVLYDNDKNMWNLDTTGLIRIKWSGSYYLQYDEQEIALNKQVVVFNNASKILNLYGTIYKINKDESVETLKEETIIEDTIVPKFYKLADRKYLLIASEIQNEKGNFNASDYLIVELDKLGNATLTNNKLNMKTLTETILITSAYTFDIANEILNFGEEDIDLKKIIGSTNMYEPPEKESTEGSGGTGSGSGGTGTGSGGGSVSGDGSGTGGGTGTGTGGSSGSGNGGSDNGTGSESGSSGEITDNRVYQDKNFSIVKNTIGTNYLNIDYSIYDPKNEYKNVFLEIENDVTKEVETYYLAKTGTNLKISGLLPNTKYNIIYKYSYTDENMNVLYESFDTNYSIMTLLPETTIEVTKMTKKELYYTLSENEKLMFSANVDLYIDDVKVDTYTFTSESASDAYYGVFDIRKYEDFTYLTLKCTSITYATGPIDTDITIRVKN